MIKLISLAFTILSINSTLASYQIAVPLEQDKGGALPNDTIIIGNKAETTPSQPETPELTCMYKDDETFGYYVDQSSLVFINNELAQDANGFNLDSFTYNGVNYKRGSRVKDDFYEVCY